MFSKEKRLVAGPPCGGKTTFVAHRAGPGEVVLDFDDIVENLTGDRYSPRTPALLASARQLWIAALPAADWVIWTAPRRRDRGRFRSQFEARVYVVMASLEECLRRAASERPETWQTSIREWFAAWEPSRSGQETVIVTGTVPCQHPSCLAAFDSLEAMNDHFDRSHAV